MQAGDKIFVVFVAENHLKAYVSEYVVLDPTHRVVKRESTGDARVLASFETAHATEAAAWEQAAREMLAYSANLRIQADECLKQAARAGIVTVQA